MFNFVEFSASCAKGLLIALNVLCILIGLCTFGFAVVDLNLLQQYGKEQTGGCYVGDIIIIVASLLLVGIASFGCVGVARGSVKILYLYIGFVMLMVIVELLVSIYVSLQRYGLQFRITEWIREDFYKNVTMFEMKQHSKLWDDLHTTRDEIALPTSYGIKVVKIHEESINKELNGQDNKKYECCGLNGPDDFLALGQTIPVSCCSRAYGARSDRARKLMYMSCLEYSTYFKSGCEEEILSTLKSDSDFLIGAVGIAFWFEALCILVAMLVTKHLRNSVQVYKNTVNY